MTKKKPKALPPARDEKILPKAPHRDPDAFQLPHNLEAERSTLGAALLNEVSADYIVDHLAPSDYWRHAHRTIFEAIRDLRHKNVGVDLTTIRQALSKQTGVTDQKGATLTLLDDVGGAAYVASLADGVPKSTNVAHYAGILKDLHAQRALVQFAQDTIDLVATGEHGHDALLLDADRRLIELQAGHAEGRMLSLAESSGELLADLEWREQHRGELTGIETGYSSINELTMGWQPGDLNVIGARPSIGKTTFVMNSAVAAARAGKKVAVFSLEMRRKQLQYRLLSQIAQVPATQLLAGAIMSQDWPKVAAANQEMTNLGMWIDDRAGVTVWDIRSACRRLKAEHGLDLVIVDYVQLIPGSLNRRGATRNEEVTDISRRLKTMADEVSAPVLLLSQLSRKARDRYDPRPQLTDLRESGALEQDADIVAFLHRKNHREGGLTNFIIEKQRSGPTGTVDLWLERDTLTFSTPTPEQVNIDAQAKQKAAERAAADKPPKKPKSGRRSYDSPPAPPMEKQFAPD